MIRLTDPSGKDFWIDTQSIFTLRETTVDGGKVGTLITNRYGVMMVVTEPVNYVVDVVERDRSDNPPIIYTRKK